MAQPQELTNLRIKGTPIFLKNYESNARYSINSGGTRSSKTYSLMQLAYIIAYNSIEPTTISVCSETMPHLKRGAMKDFFDFLAKSGIYNPKAHNKSDNFYTINNSRIEFFSVDTPAKVHGASRDYLFCNELQNWNYETFFQLVQRTNKQIYVDFNPTHEFFIHTHFINNPDLKNDITLIKSTIYDNPFISKHILKDVELRAAKDENYKRVYLLGEIGSIEGLIFDFEQINQVPEHAEKLPSGLDFGFTNDPTALVDVYRSNDTFYLDERLYKTGLVNLKTTQNNSIEAEFELLGISKIHPIVADCADPKSITDLRNLGYNIYSAIKGQDSIRKSIEICKQYKVYVTKRSLNLIKELRSYKYLTDKKTGKSLNDPNLSTDNHLIDGWRYVALFRDRLWKK